MTEPIKTERLVLKPYDDGDQGAMIELLTNEKIKETFMIREFDSLSDAIGMFQKLERFSLSSDHYERGIYVGKQLIGFLNDVSVTGDKIELGYVIHPKYQNNGYATEALGAAIGDLFRKGFSEVVAGAFLDNTASLRVMEKCGMTRIDKEEEIRYHNQTRRCRYYAIRSRRAPA